MSWIIQCQIVALFVLLLYHFIIRSSYLDFSYCFCATASEFDLNLRFDRLNHYVCVKFNYITRLAYTVFWNFYPGHKRYYLISFNWTFYIRWFKCFKLKIFSTFLNLYIIIKFWILNNLWWSWWTYNLNIFQWWQ